MTICSLFCSVFGTCRFSQNSPRVTGNRDFSLQEIQKAHEISQKLAINESLPLPDRGYKIKKISSASFSIILPYNKLTHTKPFYEVTVKRASFGVLKKEKVFKTTSHLPLELLKTAYKRFKKMNPAVKLDSELLSIPKINLSEEYNLRWWSRDSFLLSVRKQDPIAQGNYKQVKSAYKINILVSSLTTTFQVSDMVRITNLKDIRLKDRVNFLNPIFQGLSHPNILIPTHENVRYQTAKGRQVFVTERADSDLQTYVTWGQFSERVFYSLCQQVLKGIAYLHNNNIIHRDNKPENIIVFIPKDGADPVVKITDLDHAKGPSNALVSYMPPQTPTCLPLNLRSKIVTITQTLIFDQNIETYADIWPITDFLYRESFKAERNSIGIALSFLYFSFHKQRLPYPPSGKQIVFENVLYGLSRYSVRNASGIPIMGCRSFSKIMDIDLSRRPQEEAEEMLNDCMPLLDAIREISRIL